MAWINGWMFANRLYGTWWHDVIHPGGGDDTVYGGGGNDTIDDYSSRGIAGSGGDDAFFGGSGRDLLLGWRGNDRLYGGTGSDTLYGEDGRDTLVGGAGRDALVGGAGADVLYGGRGADSFVFEDAGDSTGTHRDHIMSFSFGSDWIDLSGIDANGGRYGHQAFEWSDATQGRPDTGELMAVEGPGDRTLILGNVDRDRQAEFVIEIHDGGVRATGWSVADFEL